MVIVLSTIAIKTVGAVPKAETFSWWNAETRFGSSNIETVYSRRRTSAASLVRRPILFVRRPILFVRRPTSLVRRPTSLVRRPTSASVLRSRRRCSIIRQSRSFTPLRRRDWRRQESFRCNSKFRKTKQNLRSLENPKT